MPDLQLTDVDDCTILIETAHAYLVLAEGRRVWLPKSQVEISDLREGAYRSGTFTMPIWLAKEKELV